jgi:hypothetical protein
MSSKQMRSGQTARSLSSSPFCFRIAQRFSFSNSTNSEGEVETSSVDGCCESCDEEASKTVPLVKPFATCLVTELIFPRKRSTPFCSCRSVETGSIFRLRARAIERPILHAMELLIAHVRCCKACKESIWVTYLKSSCFVVDDELHGRKED